MHLDVAAASADDNVFSDLFHVHLFVDGFPKGIPTRLMLRNLDVELWMHVKKLLQGEVDSVSAKKVVMGRNGLQCEGVRIASAWAGPLLRRSALVRAMLRLVVMVRRRLPVQVVQNRLEICEPACLFLVGEKQIGLLPAQILSFPPLAVNSLAKTSNKLLLHDQALITFADDSCTALLGLRKNGPALYELLLELCGLWRRGWKAGSGKSANDLRRRRAAARYGAHHLWLQIRVSSRRRLQRVGDTVEIAVWARVEKVCLPVRTCVDASHCYWSPRHELLDYCGLGLLPRWLSKLH